MPLDSEIEQAGELAAQTTAFLLENGAKIFSAILVLLIGFWLAGWLRNFLLKRFEKRGLDVTLSKFIAGFVRLLIITMAVLFAIAKFYSISPLVALLGASAFGVTLAIQGPISNYGAGIVIILTRPFVVGNTLTVQGQYGQVQEITLAYTQLVNEDGEVITIPNKHIMGEIFVNSRESRIIEGVIGISYESDPDAAIAAIREAVQGVEGISRDKPPQVGIDAFADSSVNIAYRCWVPTNAYHATRFVVNRAVYRAVLDCGAAIPFPQLDVAFKNESPRLGGQGALSEK